MDLNLNIDFKNINWSQFATGDYWFGIDSVLHQTDKLFFYGGALLIIIGIIAISYARFAANQFLAKVARQVSKIFVTIGVLELLWFGLRYEVAQVIGTRFVAFLILLVGLIWLYYPIRYLISHYETDMTRARREASREKYLNLNR
jgi:hypothetical protein